MIKQVLGRKRNRLLLPDGRSEFPYLGDHDEFRAITTKVREFQYIQRNVYVIEKLIVVSEPLTAAVADATRAVHVETLGNPFAVRLHHTSPMHKSDWGKCEECTPTAH